MSEIIAGSNAKSLTFNALSQSKSIDGLKITDRNKEKVAKEFESLFLTMLFKGMKNTVPKSGLMGDSLAEDIFTEMLYEESAKRSASQGGIGLADMILKSLEENDKISKYDSKYSMQMKKDFVPLNGAKKYLPVGDRSTPWQRVNNYDSIIESCAAENNLDPNLVKSVIFHESAGRAGAVSPKGAKGLMQLMDPTAKELGVENPFDPVENISGGTKYLGKLMDKYNGDTELALAAYNAGPGNVDKHSGVPPFDETKNYIKKVMKTYSLLGGTDGKAD